MMFAFVIIETLSFLLFLAYFLEKKAGSWHYDWRSMLKKGCFISVIVLLGISWWFIRSYIVLDGDILGLKTEKKEEMLDGDIEALIAERQQARKDKNFARADEIRDELLAKGIVLEDTREGVRWKRA